MRYVLTLLLILAWQSDWPIAPDSITIEVRGGVVETTTIAPDGKSGEVRISADAECATVVWHATTESGLPVTITRSWFDGCPRFYLPLFGGGDGK